MQRGGSHDRVRLPRRARLDGRGAGARRRPSGARRPSGRSRTSRSPGRPIAPALVHALAMIKAEAARVNRLDRPMKDAIAAAAEEVVSGAHDDQFPIDVFQTGSGTSSNMNANEVIARLASARASARRCTRTTTSTCRSRRTTCSRRRCTSPPRSRSPSGSLPAMDEAGEGAAQEAARVRARGEERAHAPDGRDAGHPRPGVRRLRRAGRGRRSRGSHDTLPRLCALPLGGTAVGTGINAPKGFARKVIARLATRTGPPAHRGEGPLRRAGRARRARRDERPAARRSRSR